MNPEIQLLILKSAAVLKSFGAQEVYLFGSMATGNSTGYSDVDFAVSGMPPQVFFKAMGAAGEVLGLPLDLVDLDEDNPFTRYLKKEGELLRVA